MLSPKTAKFTMSPTYYLETLWNKWLLADSEPMFRFHKITPNCMRLLIRKLNNSHSECRDGLSNYIVKIGEDSLVYPMTYLFNKIVDSQEFPTFWKYFIAIEIYKGKGEKDDPSSYRPIALLSPLSKLIEMELLDQMDKHMTQNNLWNPNSFAYRKHHSTTNALIDIMEIWSDNIDCNTQNLNMFIDLSAAFDCVEHDILLSKLR